MSHTHANPAKSATLRDPKTGILTRVNEYANGNVSVEVDADKDGKFDEELIDTRFAIMGVTWNDDAKPSQDELAVRLEERKLHYKQVEKAIHAALQGDLTEDKWSNLKSVIHGSVDLKEAKRSLAEKRAAALAVKKPK